MHRILSRLALAVAIVLFLTLSAFAAETAAPKAAPPQAGANAVLIPAGDLKWNDVPDFPGVKMALVHGDPNTGPSDFFMKLPAGFSAPLHFHDPDHWVAVVSGTLMLAPEGAAEKTLPPGSGFGFTGKKNHTTKCAAGADCVLFIDARGKWDVIPIAKK